MCKLWVREKKFEMTLEFIFFVFVEHFFRSLGIRRSKRGDRTMRQSISMMQNMSYKEFFELGTKWKLIFTDGI